MAFDRDRLLQLAREQLGDPYVYGATGPNSFDCSGLTQWLYKQVGISIPRTSQEQWRSGTAVSAADLQPGDLVFAAGSDGTAASPGHVALYIGNQQVIAAPHTGADVRIQSLQSLRPTGYRRYGGGGTGSSVVPADLTTPAGLLSWPGEVSGFFSDATDSLSATADFARAFFQPSTYVRLGSGFFGALLLVAGLFFLVREAGAAE